MLGEPRAAPTSIHFLLKATACSRSAASAEYWLCSSSAAISTTAELAFSTALRNCSRYLGSVEGKTRLQGSILWTLNFAAMCAAKSFNSICCAAGTELGELPSHPFHPTMNSRNGYAATATRSRGAAGNFTEGSEFAASASPGSNQAPAAAPAHCSRNSLLVFGFMRASVTEKSTGGADGSVDDGRPSETRNTSGSHGSRIFWSLRSS